jgi:F-type H+-transporting ATPase subunit b
VELNWTTFILEIINFLVLVWILQRFLYKPVLAVIARRREGIEHALNDAKQMRAEAKKLQHKYQGRLSDWEQEREQARAKLQQEIEAERTRQQKELETILAQEREKAEVAEERRMQDIIRKGEETALQQGARFAARLLQEVAGPELEARLLQLLLTDLQQLPAERLAKLRAGWAEPPADIRVTSAYPLSDEQQKQLQQILAETTALDVPCQFSQDPELVAGLRIAIGSWVLAVNVRDELKSFAELGPGRDSENV